MMKNENGFSIVEVFIVLIIIGVLGAVGWSAYNSQASNKNDGQTATQKSDQQQAGSKELSGYTYELPEQWSKLSCDSDMVLVYPDNDKATDCNDRSNLILISRDPYAAPNLPHCLTQEEVTTIKQSKPLESYTCSTLTVAGKQVIKETTDQGTDEDSNKVISVNYTFVQDKPLRFRYQATADGKLLYADLTEQLIKSVNF